MTRKSYTVIYEEDPDGGFVASVPALPRCYSQGDTLEDTQQHIIEAIKLYLESAQESHTEPTTEYRIWQSRVEVAF